MTDKVESHLIHMKVEAASLEATGALFGGAKAILSTLPVAECTINQLELELELLKTVHGIFKGSGPDSAPNSMQGIVDMYAERMKDIENEILERLVLV